ncbi:MAG: type II toxin-antitoxin system PemK/MazF family toxin [Polyangiaceae bacterium]
MGGEPWMDGRVRIALERGRVVLVEIDVEKGLTTIAGPLLRRTRLSVLVSDNSVNEALDFPLVAVVPLSGARSIGALYPALAPGKGGIIKTSYALIDHVRSVDKRRIRKIFGFVTKAELSAIDRGLALYLSLATGSSPFDDVRLSARGKVGASSTSPETQCDPPWVPRRQGALDD